jgi:hypothetical protein
MSGVKHSWLAGLLQFDRDTDTFVVTAPEGVNPKFFFVLAGVGGDGTC